MGNHATTVSLGTKARIMSRAFDSNQTSTSFSDPNQMISAPGGDGFRSVDSASGIKCLFIGEGADNNDFQVQFNGWSKLSHGQWASTAIARVQATVGTAAGAADVPSPGTGFTRRDISESDLIADTLTLVGGDPAWADRVIISPADNRNAWLILYNLAFDFIEAQIDINAGSSAITNANVVWGLIDG